MKLNLSRLVLTAGLSIGIISFASVAEAGIELNGSSLRGQSNKQPQPSQQLKVIRLNGTKLNGQSSNKHLPSQQLKSSADRGDNSTSLRGQSSSKSQPSQQLKKRCSAVLGGTFKVRKQVPHAVPWLSPMSDCIKKLSQNSSRLTGQTSK